MPTLRHCNTGRTCYTLPQENFPTYTCCLENHNNTCNKVTARLHLSHVSVICVIIIYLRLIRPAFCIVDVEVLQLYATDPDSGANGRISFSLVESSSLFHVSSDGRMTTTAQGSSLDRETQDMYYLTVRASDGGSTPNTGTQLILITNITSPCLLMN